MATRKGKGEAKDTRKQERNRGPLPDDQSRVPTPNEHELLSPRLAGLFRSPWVAAGVPVLFALLASLNSLANLFAYDDDLQIVNNESIRNIANLPRMLTGTVWSLINNQNEQGGLDLYYRPIFSAFLSIGYWLFGTMAWEWHLALVLIHAGVVYLVWLVISEISGDRWLAAIAASLFAVHPAHAESVAWISGAPDPLMALFALSSFFFYVRYRKSGRGFLLGLSAVLFFIALLSKETAVVLPAALVAWEVLLAPRKRPLNSELVRGALRLGLYAGALGAYFFIRWKVTGAILFGTTRLSTSTALKTVPGALVKYLSLNVIPFGYSIQHVTRPVGSVTSPAFLFPVLMILVAAGAAFLTRSRLLYFAAAWFLIWLAPVLAALRMFFSVFAVTERYLYLPSIGACLAAALGVRWVANRSVLGRARPEAALALAAPLILVLAGLSMVQNTFWKDDLTLFEHVVDVNPDSPYSHNSLSTVYYQKGRLAEAQRQAKIANELDPHCLDPYLNLAYYQRAKGNLRQAAAILELARTEMADGPLNQGEEATLCVTLSLLYEELNRPEDAERSLKQVIDLRPESPGAWEALGDFQFSKGRYDEALSSYRRSESLQLLRVYSKIHLKLGRTLDQLNDPQDAGEEYKAYLNLAPDGYGAAEARSRLTSP
jgi:tetratricopeptide (TPR) repeat protein